MRREAYFPSDKRRWVSATPPPTYARSEDPQRGGLRLPAFPLMAAFLERPVRVLVWSIASRGEGSRLVEVRVARRPRGALPSGRGAVDLFKTMTQRRRLQELGGEARQRCDPIADRLAHFGGSPAPDQGVHRPSSSPRARAATPSRTSLRAADEGAALRAAAAPGVSIHHVALLAGSDHVGGPRESRDRRDHRRRRDHMGLLSQIPRVVGRRPAGHHRGDQGDGPPGMGFGGRRRSSSA